jgi:hypothetical protein
MTQFIAERRLLFSQKGSNVKNELVIRIARPYIVTEDMLAYSVVGAGVFGCHVEI